MKTGNKRPPFNWELLTAKNLSPERKKERKSEQKRLDKYLKHGVCVFKSRNAIYKKDTNGQNTKEVIGFSKGRSFVGSTQNLSI